MTELFGIPMSTIVLVLAAMLVVSLLSVAWVYLRRRVIFRLGARNIPRRKAQTALIVFGLMLSTLIVTAALGTGDTVNGSMTSEVYGQLGPIDQFVADRSEEELDANSFTATIPASTWTELQPTIDGIEQIDGASPMLERRVSARELASGIGSPELVVVGLDPRDGRFGRRVDRRQWGRDRSRRLACWLGGAQPIGCRRTGSRHRRPG